jgi:MFS family permease
MGCSPCTALPARLPFYYGWVIVGLFIFDAVVCSTWTTMLLNMLTMGELYLSFEKDGVSRVLVSSMFAVGTISAALLSPVAGRAIDRWGGQVMMPMALCVLGVGCLMIALVPTSSPWLLAPTFFFARGGAKCMTSPYRSAVLNQWFYSKRGKATATIIITQQCLTNFVVCPVYGMLLISWGWRKASFLGFFLNVGAAPLFGLLLFHTPESVGLLPDGAKAYARLSAEDDSEAAAESSSEPGPGAEEKPNGEVTEPAGGEGRQAEQDQREEQTFSFTRAEAFRTLPGATQSACLGQGVTACG